MTVIWGLDLKEIQWGKFKNSYMWNNAYHLRRTKFIVYQLAMILCVVSESLGTDVLSNCIDQQKTLKQQSGLLGHEVTIENNDVVGSFSYNIFVGVFVATIFGAAFFFDLFWPERHESKAVMTAWKACAILSCIFTLSSAILLTVIMATHRAHLVGDVTGLVIPTTPALSYKKNGEAIASVVLIWLGWLATCAATGVMFKSVNHIEQYGAKAGHLRKAEGSTPGPLDGAQAESRLGSNAKSVPDVDSEKDAQRI